MSCLQMMMTAYGCGIDVLLRHDLSVKIKHRIVLKPMIIVHRKLLGNVSIDRISAARQAVRTLKLDRENT